MKISSSYFWALWRSRSWQRSTWGKEKLFQSVYQLQYLFSSSKKNFLASWSSTPSIPHGLWTIHTSDISRKNISLQAIVWPEDQFSLLAKFFIKESSTGQHLLSESHVLEQQSSSYFSFTRWLEKKSRSILKLDDNVIHKKSDSYHFLYKECSIESKKYTDYEKILKNLLLPETLWIKIQDTVSNLFFYMLYSPPVEVLEKNTKIFSKILPSYTLALQGSWIFPFLYHIKNKNLTSCFVKGQKIFLFLRSQIPPLILKLKEKLWAEGHWGQYTGHIACRLMKGSL